VTHVAALGTPSAESQRPQPRNLAEAAQQFESLLIEQMLRSMRETEGEGWMGSGSDQAGASLMEFAEQEMSRVIAAGGGFGLAKLLRDSLTPRSDKTPAEAGTRPNR
jgi:flagellar protein FlgJ